MVFSDLPVAVVRGGDHSFAVEFLRGLLQDVGEVVLSDHIVVAAADVEEDVPGLGEPVPLDEVPV